MRTLVINPPNVPITTNSIGIEPIDVLTIATYVKNLGNETRVLDMDKGDGKISELNSLLIEGNLDLVVIIYDYHIPLFQDGSQEKLLEIIKICKSHSLKVIVGGKLSTYAPQKLLMNDTFPDVVIFKEMENPLKKLLRLNDWSEDNLNTIPNIGYRKGNGLKITQKEDSDFDLGELSIPDRNMLDVNQYIDVRTMLTSRSCSFGCSFCSIPDFWGKRRVRSVEDVVREIEYLANNFGARKILFLDDNATIEKDRMKEISKILINLKLNIRLGCLGNMRHFDEEMMNMMYDAGFRWIHYGVESGSEKLLRKINKFIPKKQVENIIKNTKKIGFRVRTSLIMDLPGTNLEDLKETSDLILDLEPHEIRIHYLAIRFGSKLFNESISNSLIIPKQYIHGGRPQAMNNNTTSEMIDKSISGFIKKLSSKNYLKLDNIEKNSIFENKNYGSDVKIVSFCPLKYGIGWI